MLLSNQICPLFLLPEMGIAYMMASPDDTGTDKVRRFAKTLLVSAKRGPLCGGRAPFEHSFCLVGVDHYERLF